MDMLSSKIIRFICFAVFWFTASPSFAQTSLRDSLIRLDVDGDGEIDPAEVTPLARPFLEQIMRNRSRELSFDRPMEIERILEAASSYYRSKNGAYGQSIRPVEMNSIKPFGTDRDQPLIPGFGLAEVKFPYVQDDLDEADETLGRYDRNDDQYIDRREAARSRWTHRNPFDDDLNKDGRLSRMELAQRYARRRLLSDDSQEFRKQEWRSSATASDNRNRNQRERSWYSRGGSDTWLTASMLGRFDANRNGQLEIQETHDLGIPIRAIDLDRDNVITRDELLAHIKVLQEQAGDVSEGIPGWFYELDANNDRQIDIPEFVAPEKNAQRYIEFESLDANNDGLITASEVLQSSSIVGGNYQNNEATVLAPRRTTISEIEIEDDFVIRDINVHLSITHSNISYLDGYLIGPEGQRVELFTEIGGSGDNFDQTKFDDQSSTSITKAKPPYQGSFAPEDRDKKQPSLRQFTGTNVRGVWQLIIRGTRNTRFGMLHSWGLMITPIEEIPSVEENDDGSE